MYTTKQAETAIIFQICALAEVGNIKNNLIAVSITTKFGKFLFRILYWVIYFSTSKFVSFRQHGKVEYAWLLSLLCSSIERTSFSFNLIQIYFGFHGRHISLVSAPKI